MTKPKDAPRVELSLDHVGIAAADLEAALRQLAGIFLSPPSAPEEVGGEGLRVAFVPAGGPRLEILESRREGSPIARFLSRRGPGLHHLSFRVRGIGLEEWFATLKARGLRVLGDGPRAGAEGRRVFFVHPESAAGVLLEFSQEAEGEA